MHTTMQSLRTGYKDLGRSILAHGDPTAPRGESTMEVLGASFTCLDPVDSLTTGSGRGVVKALAATEALQLIGGFHDPETLVAAAPHFEAFLDPETGAQRSPYGPRLEDQIPYAIETLKADKDTRRAQVVVWDARLDAKQGLHDYPCTTSLQWLVRGDRLHMQVHMRSNDFWLGVPYDVFEFTQVQLAVASILGIEPGHYRHSAASLHVYEKHYEKVNALVEPTDDPAPAFGIVASSWDEARNRAITIHHGDRLPDEPGAGERWLHLAMAKVRG